MHCKILPLIAKHKVETERKVFLGLVNSICEENQNIVPKWVEKYIYIKVVDKIFI